MIRKGATIFPEQPRQKAAYLLLAEYLWAALGKSSSEVYKHFSSVYGQTPEELKSLVDRYYSNRDPPKPLSPDFLDLVGTEKPWRLLQLARGLIYGVNPELDKGLRFLENPNSYLRTLYDDSVTTLSIDEITQALLDTHGIKIGNLEFLSRGFHIQCPHNPEPAIEMQTDSTQLLSFQLRHGT